MKKIPSVFIRDKKTHFFTMEVNPECQWVLDGEGIATEKFDGTCCMIKDGVIYKRYDAKHGKTPPEGFIPAQEPDSITGHWPGWIECYRNNPNDKYHFEAFDLKKKWKDGTYELCGPKINTNRENLDSHILYKHGMSTYFEPLGIKRTYDSIQMYVLKIKGETPFLTNVEGIIFHHPDGRMAKVKYKDFSIFNLMERVWLNKKGKNQE